MASRFRLLLITTFLCSSLSEFCFASGELVKLDRPASILNPTGPSDFCRTVLSVISQQGANFNVVKSENEMTLVGEFVQTTAEGYKNFVEGLRNIDAQQRHSIGIDSIKRIFKSGARRAFDIGLNAYSLIKNRKLVGWTLSNFQTIDDAVSDMKWFIPDPNVRLNPAQMQFSMSNRIVITRADSDRFLKMLDGNSEVDQRQICGPLSAETCTQIVPTLQQAIIEGNFVTEKKGQALALETSIDVIRNIQNSPERKDELTLRVRVRVTKLFNQKMESDQPK